MRERPARESAARRTFALLAVLSGTASASEPAGAPAPGRVPAPLTWHAPAGCGSAKAVQARVGELLGEPELAYDGVQVEARVSETRGGWALHLLTRDALGTRERELAADQCSDLVEAAAIAITLAFEAARDAAAPADAAPADVAPARPSELVPQAASEPGALPGGFPERETSTRVAGGAELIVDLSSLASVAAGPSLFAALGWDALSLELNALWLPGTDKAVGPAQAVEISLLAGGLRLCYALGRGLMDTALCAGLDAGQLTARGAGLRESRVVHDPWLSAQAGLELSRELTSGVALRARGEIIAPLLRQTYGVNETEAVYSVASVAARVALGVRVTF